MSKAEASMSTTSLMTFAEFEQLPDIPGKRELIDGELIELPPPKLSHSQIAKYLCRLLLQSLPETRVWQEAGYRIAGGWLQPDVSVTWPEQNVDNDYLVGAPSLAVEILSPRNTAAEIDRKITLYLSEGGGEVWVVNSKRKIMTVYRASAGQVLRIVVDSTYASELLGLSIGLSQIFPTDY
jgi:Uma2 family endonuclease